MTSTTIATRVDRGAAWLDKHYPNWWQVIDLGTLKIAECSKCVLGQVFSRAIPDAEQDQILAQVINQDHLQRAKGQIRLSVNWGDWDGYTSLVKFHGIFSQTQRLAFSIGPVSACDDNGDEMTATQEFDALTAEWTRLIIERRINANLAEVTELWQVNRAEVAALVAA